MEPLKFELTLEQANIVLGALAKQPYEVVTALIAELQKQAQPQITPAAPTEAEGEAKY